MAHWNYRVVQMKHEDGFSSFGVHEVYYDSEDRYGGHYDDGIKIAGYTEKPVRVCGETIAELRETLERMLRCLDKPVLVDGEVIFS